MRIRTPLALLLAFVALSLALFARTKSSAENAETPIGPKWWPSKWGPDDQRGAANLLTEKKVLEAKECISSGKVYSLGRLYEHGMPIPGKRHFSLTIPGLPTGTPSGKNGLVHNDELVSGEIGQIGTQFDGLGHIGVHMGNEDIFYNGNKLSEFGDTYGLKKLGVENVGPVFTRGILLDVAAAKGVRQLPIGYAISVDDLKSCLKESKLTIRPGDIVLIRTGHGQLWMADNKSYAEGEPGLSLGGAKWLSEQQVALVGSDNWAVEVVPSENPDRPFEVHQWLLVRSGIYILENLDLEALARDIARDKVYEFAFVFAPLRLKGATGSPGNPVAVR
ncbi:MAG: cyclase family protein [Planctomycetales bacterium]|nr:cyclase family protein [Planctomycetales bacterium]